ncbi:hypothetical protein E2P81_ATG03180 [Venturia nashicola]|uniref:Uncharacterized protein n=1 Tax=Venturia nashicola TaxID=86259 RepID=A0A4Z1PEE8_9PEZI|nr:hypothetical protein E6O75_ATG03252 [Venturia nashicola]TLD36291.1 hypothetical protein E2P81_ATG03180 [Venturia nashicola]
MSSEPESRGVTQDNLNLPGMGQLFAKLAHEVCHSSMKIPYHLPDHVVEQSQRSVADLTRGIVVPAGRVHGESGICNSCGTWRSAVFPGTS